MSSFRIYNVLRKFGVNPSTAWRIAAKLSFTKSQ